MDVDLKHHGILGMRWGRRKPEVRAVLARRKAELAKEDIRTLDQKERLKKAKAMLNPGDKSAKQHLKLETKASKAETRARRLEIISRYSAPKADSGTNKGFNDRFVSNRGNDRPKFDRTRRDNAIVNDVSNAPYRSEDRSRNQGFFKKAAQDAAMKSTSAAAVKVVTPAAEHYGKKLLEKILEKYPSSALTHVDICSFLEHHGVKGMKWHELHTKTVTNPSENPISHFLDEFNTWRRARVQKVLINIYKNNALVDNEFKAAMAKAFSDAYANSAAGRKEARESYVNRSLVVSGKKPKNVVVSQ